MNEVHQAWLLLGSNIHPQIHLRQAIEMLRSSGGVVMVSRAWESGAVGGGGPNFLNACVLLRTTLGPADVIDSIIRPVEDALGRVRTGDRYAPRPMDIDLLLYDNQPLRPDYWEQAFALVPLAELAPDFEHPETGEPLIEAARRLRERVWIVPRPEVLEGLQSMPTAGLDS